MYRITLIIYGLLGGIHVLCAQELMRGHVVDAVTHDPVEFALVTTSTPMKAITDHQGNFQLLVHRNDSVMISLVGYRRTMLKVDAKLGRATIQLQRGAIDLAAVTINPLASTAFTVMNRIDLNLRPVNSSQDLMRLVPGLFLGQHQGGGIAEHIFFRGFDADHGTDVNVAVDDMPLNLVSHAHGQGFADLHYLIPELVSNYSYGKGPYYPAKGDFTTAGFVSFQTKDELERNEIKLEGGQFHSGRVVGLINLLSDKAAAQGQHAYIAGEAAYTDGPFKWPQHFSRVNLFGKYNAQLSVKAKLTATLSTYSSDWRSSGEIPERAVKEGLVDRFGYIDSAQGGYTSRSNVIVRLQTTLSDHVSMENQVYYSRYLFNEHYDPTLFADDSINGDQLRQREARDLFGYNGKLTKHIYFSNGADLSTTAGLGWQLNKIYNSELSHTINYNHVLEYLQLGDVQESSVNGYIEENYRIGKWDINGGLRFDRMHFEYFDKLNPQQPARNKLVISPKVNVAYTATDAVSFYLKTGKGFHSNDAKVVAANQGINIMPSAYGADVGMNWKPMPRLLFNASVWILYLQQELVYDADEGTFEPGDKTRRQGLDISGRYQFNSWLYAIIDINFCRARDVQAAKGENYLPLAVPLSSTGGIYFKRVNGFNGGIGYRYMKDRPANDDNSVIAQGYFVTDLTAAYTRKKYEVGIAVENLLNTKWREAQFDVTSRMKGEPLPVDDISFTPGVPFLAKLKFAVFF